MKVNMIFARSRNGVIGKDNALPWHSPTDMKRFRELTAGGIVVMGGKTWSSLPARFRPLPGRTNIVVTTHPEARGVERAICTLDLASVLKVAGKTSEPLWIIGGAQIYTQFLEAGVVTDIYETVVGVDVDGDAMAPAIPAGFALTSTNEPAVSEGEPSLIFNHFSRT